MIQVVTDSSCDLAPEVVRELGIEVVPISVSFGGEVYRDGELPPDQFWARAAGPHPPLTSQPPLGVFEELFERLVSGGKQVLCLTVTSKHSGTFDTARLAGKRLGEEVQVFDSLSTSLGLGYQAVQAALAARAGEGMHQVVARLEDLRSRMHLLIVLDTLESVRRGGRADAFMGIAERMTRFLNIKAMISMVEGQLRLQGAARSLRGALGRVQDTVEHLGSLEALSVMHARNAGVAEQVAAALAQRGGLAREWIWVRETGAALATHAGAGMVAVMAVRARTGDAGPVLRPAVSASGQV